MDSLSHTFSQAFDVVRRVLGVKLAQLKLPASILQWIISFLNGRTQQVKYASFVSSFKPINMRIAQGSGFDPTLYIVTATDLKALSVISMLFRFADDTTLLVPENTDIDLLVEFQHIRCWAEDNHMIINLEKTEEIVFHTLAHPYRHV